MLHQAINKIQNSAARVRLVSGAGGRFVKKQWTKRPFGLVMSIMVVLALLTFTFKTYLEKPQMLIHAQDLQMLGNQYAYAAFQYSREFCTMKQRNIRWESHLKGLCIKLRDRHDKGGYDPLLDGDNIFMRGISGIKKMIDSSLYRVRTVKEIMANNTDGWETTLEDLLMCKMTLQDHRDKMKKCEEEPTKVIEDRTQMMEDAMQSSICSFQLACSLYPDTCVKPLSAAESYSSILTEIEMKYNNMFMPFETCFRWVEKDQDYPHITGHFKQVSAFAHRDRILRFK